MKKFLVFLLLVIIAPFIGGLYGILHDQLTYTVSEEYYTKFKFVQFALAEWGLGRNIGTEAMPTIQLTAPRQGAAIVGFLSTWWVGLVIGVILGLIAWLYKEVKTMFRMAIRAILLTIFIALMTGLVGLLYGKLFLTEVPDYGFLPQHLVHKERFLMVSAMHNFSYLGGLIGLIGLIVGAVYLLRNRKRVALIKQENR